MTVSGRIFIRFYVGAIIRVIPVDVRGINKLLFEEEV